MESGPGDETLLLAVAGRDMGAFRTLYERHAGWLSIRLARRGNDPDLVAGGIQDTFLGVRARPRGSRGRARRRGGRGGLPTPRREGGRRPRGGIPAVSEPAGTVPAKTMPAAE